MKKFIIMLIVLNSLTILSAQNIISDYELKFNNKKYSEVLEITLKRLDDFYKKRVKDKRIPSSYTSIEDIGETVDLMKLYRNRKEKGFFIEENLKVAKLHYFSGKSFYELKKYRDALNHFTQSLRFRKLVYKRDDKIFYDISQVFKAYKNKEYKQAYYDSLEQAYTLNPGELNYSLELANALYPTVYKKKSIFHLKRYLEGTKKDFDKKLYLKLANLYETIGRYLETEKYYLKYIETNNDDAEVHFALGYIAYYRTGNFPLSKRSFIRTLELVGKDDLDRNSKCYEFLGDMHLSDLKYELAESSYLKSIDYQEQKRNVIDKKILSLSKLDKEINELKQKLIYENNFQGYEEFELLKDDKGKLEYEIRNLEYEYRRLNSGKIRWNLGNLKVKTGKLDEAVRYFRESIKFDYKANLARERIVKLQLKIKRGY